MSSGPEFGQVLLSWHSYNCKAMADGEHSTNPLKFTHKKKNLPSLPVFFPLLTLVEQGIPFQAPQTHPSLCQQPAILTQEPKQVGTQRWDSFDSTLGRLSRSRSCWTTLKPSAIQKGQRSACLKGYFLTKWRKERTKQYKRTATTVSPVLLPMNSETLCE